MEMQLSQAIGKPLLILKNVCTEMMAQLQLFMPLPSDLKWKIYQKLASQFQVNPIITVLLSVCGPEKPSQIKFHFSKTYNHF